MDSNLPKKSTSQKKALPFWQVGNIWHRPEEEVEITFEHFILWFFQMGAIILLFFVLGAILIDRASKKLCQVDQQAGAGSGYNQTCSPERNAQPLPADGKPSSD